MTFLKIINLPPEICWKDEDYPRRRDEPFPPPYMEMFQNRQTTQEHTILSWKDVDQQANSSSTLLISFLNILISEDYASTKVCFYLVMTLM